MSYKLITITYKNPKRKPRVFKDVSFIEWYEWADNAIAIGIKNFKKKTDTIKYIDHRGIHNIKFEFHKV